MKVVEGVRGQYVASLLVAIAIAGLTWYVLLERGDVRLLASGAVAAGLAACAVTRPRGMVVAMLAGLPLLGLVRRLFDVLARQPVDPLLAVVPALTCGLTIFAFHAFRSTVGRSLAESRMTQVATALAVVFTLAIFNPMQGDILVGLSGALFLLVPLLWYFLGRSYLDDATTQTILRGTVVLGLICGAYGILQALLGFTGFDQAWIDERASVFQSLRIGRFFRPMATFPSPEEWSRYMMVSGTVAFGFLSGTLRGRLLAMLSFGVAVASLLLCAVRISVIGFLLSLAVLLVASARSRTLALMRVAVLALALVLFLTLVPALSWEEITTSDRALDAFFGHTSRGLRTPFEEDSFQVRLTLWWKLMVDFVPQHPLGTGLGGSTLGGVRFGNGVYVMTESYAVGVFVAAGIIGGGLFLALTFLALKKCARIVSERASRVDAIVAAVVVGILFTSLTGNSLSLYSIGPLGWALIGWLSLPRAGQGPVRPVTATPHALVETG